MTTAPQQLHTPSDPYALDPRDIQDPPTAFPGRLRFLGPGMITSAAVVGSGELITATTLGAQVGFAPVAGAGLDVREGVGPGRLGRWAISTGQVAVNGYDQVPPRVLRRGWMSWVVLLMWVQS